MEAGTGISESQSTASSIRPSRIKRQRSWTASRGAAASQGGTYSRFSQTVHNGEEGRGDNGNGAAIELDQIADQPASSQLPVPHVIVEFVHGNPGLAAFS